MDQRQAIGRLAELKAEGDAIMQQLIASGMPPEQIMAALEGGGQPAPPPPGMNIPGMGGQPGPDLPPGIPANGSPGVNAANVALAGGGPRGLLGAV
jgi:hypothetical protein